MQVENDLPADISPYIYLCSGAISAFKQIYIYHDSISRDERDFHLRNTLQTLE